MTPAASPVLQDAPDTDHRPTGHCPHCDADVPLRLSRSGPHVRGDCAVCGAYIRFVEQPGVLPFGRYRGQPITQVPRDYLAWLRRTPDVWGKLSEGRRQTIEEVLRDRPR
ncbi:MAG: hypothetical protein A3F84_25145 [Candidatus Handelsmanbacteria bacterium RIFCSPLOWO2_12_FULL_64_10]|uniref:Uncharacterized protein n=1 Tax=Handelsmanbacteria sp. (strain RIFCSPLOWO2_12_FULL_64_10) TaxID=1817868 RepID=A0A1F6CCF0_HANXR|nr:MAG: hypothetical protein A3F84_25145 [Candidatus Handelsmanbacteria bacterium RIFCSPLOWO2_12_FULL_64_10]